MRVNKWLVHAIAQCDDCGFEDSNYETAQKSGRDHHIKTGHTVHIETAYCQIYKQGDKDE